MLHVKSNRIVQSVLCFLLLVLVVQSQVVTQPAAGGAPLASPAFTGVTTVNADGQSLVLGTGANASVNISISGVRSFIGYDGANLVVQAGLGKALRLFTNSGTFGTGGQFTNIDTAGNVTLPAGAALQASLHQTTTNCSSAAAPAVCASAAAGSVVVAAAGTTVTVNTTAVTANSQIQLTFDSSLGAKLSVTCNTTQPAVAGISARVAATSFTITSSSPVTNPACFSYSILN